MAERAPKSTPFGEPHKGDVIAGKYLVERVIAEGGMGVVVEAMHLTLNRRVAVKLMLPEAMELPNAVERFQREAQAAAQIQSEHVVRIIDVGSREDGSPYMVMEYLEGSDLGDLVGPEKRALPIELAVDYLLQACEGMAEAHKNGVVHRDLKPSNLFLIKRDDGSPCVKVLDFGISKFSGRDEMGREQGGLTATRAMMGSPFYMSPEQLRSAKNVDRRTDIWSLGVILHELLTGAPPFEGETAGAVCAMVAADPPVPLCWVRPEAPPQLEAVILRCLEKEPEKRYQDVSELANALSAFSSKGGKNAVDRIAKSLGDASQMPTLFAAPVKLYPSRPPPTVALTKTAIETPHARTPVEKERDDEPAPKKAEKKKGRSGFLFLVMLGLVAYGAWTFRAQLMTSATTYIEANANVAPVPLVAAVDAAAGPIVSVADAATFVTAIAAALGEPEEAGISDAGSDADAAEDEDFVDDAGPVASPAHATAPHHPGKPRVLPPRHRRPKR
jgi:serine/threonine protein kinase